MDFYQIKQKTARNGVIEVYPDFKVCRSKDLMVRGKAFYGVWDEESGLWSTDEYDVPRLVDKELYDYLEPIDPEWIYNPKYLHNFHRYEVKKNKSPYSLQVIGNVFKSDFNSDNVYNAFKHENDIDKTISPTCMLHHGTSIVLEREDENGNPIIVKLTPREMLQLMGCTKENVNVMQNAIGRTGLLKVAGNSIVVDVLYHIFKSMFIK